MEDHLSFKTTISRNQRVVSQETTVLARITGIILSTVCHFRYWHGRWENTI